MLCECCKKKEATKKDQRIVSKTLVTFDVCSECYCKSDTNFFLTIEMNQKKNLREEEKKKKKEALDKQLTLW